MLLSASFNLIYFILLFIVNITMIFVGVCDVFALNIEVNYHFSFVTIIYIIIIIILILIFI